MDRGTRNLFALALVVVLAVTGGAALILGGTPVDDPDAPEGGSFMVGVIVGVDAASLGDVRAFQLRRVDGAVVDFQLDELENGAAFPPGHLAEHQATAERVRVWYRQDGDTLRAIRLEDAEP